MNPKVLIGTITYDSDWYCLKQFADSIAKLELDGIDFEHLIIDNSDTEDYCKQLNFTADFHRHILIQFYL